MATQTVREKRRANRMRKNQTALMKAQEQADEELNDEVEVIETDSEDVSKSLVEKDYGEPMPIMGPTSWEEMDAAEKAREQAEQVREVTWNVQDLVSNIAYSPMSASEKASAIKKVGEGFGKRLGEASKVVEKELDMDLLELQALIARDARHTPLLEKVGDWITKKKFKAPDNIAQLFYVHDKAHVRQALHLAVDMIEKGGDGETVAKEAIVSIKQAAKELGIGSVDRASGAVIVEKDKSGAWRAVMFPTNNFKDFDGEIISEQAHLEYVDWVNKNMDCAPVSLIWHKPGTQRAHPFDFIGYENGFMIASLPLIEKEAADFLRMQIQTDIGLSIGGIALGRDPRDATVITKYRMFEISDLPLERAANPFTEIELISKEAQMDMKKYLSGFIDDEEKINKILEKTALTQAQLREAGVKEKEKKDETPATPAAITVVKDAPTTSIEQIVEAVKKDLDVEGLSEMLTKLSEDAEKVPVLEALIKELKKDQDTELAEKISPPVEKALAWQKLRKSQSDKTVLDPKKEEDQKLEKSQPEVHWLNKATGTEPVAQ